MSQLRCRRRSIFRWFVDVELIVAVRVNLGGCTVVLLNIVLNYVAWFGVVTLSARGQFGLAVLPSLVAVGIHLAVTPTLRRRPELLLCLAAIPLGLCVEAINMWAGATQYPAGASIAGAPPLFMLGLWMAFATLANVSLAWLKDRLGLAALFGAVAAAPSYYAGSKLGALAIGEPVWLSLGIIGAVWSVAFPALLLIARRIG